MAEGRGRERKAKRREFFLAGGGPSPPLPASFGKQARAGDHRASAARLSLPHPSSFSPSPASLHPSLRQLSCRPSL